MSYNVGIVFFEEEHQETVLPKKATIMSAGFDVVCNEQDAMLYPGQIKVFKTGIGLKMPPSLSAEVRSRSSLSIAGVVVMNSPGTIDADYKGEIKVILGNYGDKPYEVKRFHRIAQILFKEVLDISLENNLGIEDVPSVRIGGFGSTGK